MPPTSTHPWSAGWTSSVTRTRACSGVVVQTTTYKYSCSFAVGLCEGEVDSLEALYFDGQEVNLNNVDYTFYKGTDTQNPDPTIESVEGVGFVPGYRNLCYIVFNDLPLKSYGNRVPQVSCLVRKLPQGSPQTLESIVNDLCLKAGLLPSEFDATDLSDINIDGYYTEGLSSPRESFEELASIYLFDVSDIEGVLTFRKKFFL